MSGDMAAAVGQALTSRKDPDPRDGGAAALALHYAGLMDAAAPAAKYRRHLEVVSRALAGAPLEEDDPEEALQAIATALAEHTVASDLGPKLLAVLGGLGLTTAARGISRGEVKSGPRNPLQVLKQQRTERLRTAG